MAMQRLVYNVSRCLSVCRLSSVFAPQRIRPGKRKSAINRPHERHSATATDDDDRERDRVRERQTVTEEGPKQLATRRFISAPLWTPNTDFISHGPIYL